MERRGIAEKANISIKYWQSISKKLSCKNSNELANSQGNPEKKYIGL